MTGKGYVGLCLLGDHPKMVSVHGRGLRGEGGGERAATLRQLGQEGTLGVCTRAGLGLRSALILIIIIIEGLSLLQSIPPTTADKQTQALILV